MRFTKVILSSVAAIALSMGAANADMMKIKIGTEGAYPPFNNLEADGTLVGFDVDIAKALCAQMKADCELVTQDWDGMIPALLAGKFDAIIASMSITDERKEKVDFTNPYYSNSLVFIASKDTKLADNSPKGMGKAVVGVQAGTIAAEYLEKNYPDVEVKAYPTQLEAYADLENGRVDAVMGDFGVLYDFVNSDEGAPYEFFGDAVSSSDKIGIATRKDDKELTEKLNKALQAIRDNGTYAKINKKYFPFDIY